MSHAIRTQGLGYRAGRHFALRDVALNVPRGAIYGFLGPNGSGKTTTIRLLLGMLPPDEGTVTLLDHDLPDGAPAALARVGYVPERLHLYPILTVEEAMRYHAAFYDRWEGARAEELRRTFGLRPEQRIARLSKGEAGKLMMLLALSTSPDLLILDEPTDGLDPVVRRDVLAALVDYVAARDATVLVSSHLVHEQERICDWVGVMDAGRLVAEMPMETFRAGIKRLRVARSPVPHPVVAGSPFSLLSRRDGAGSDEEWIVRDWRDGMASWFEAQGIALREVVHLDLEDSFVELLRSARTAGGAA